MKRSMFVPAIVVALLVVGCETQMTNPLTTDATQNASLPKAMKSDNVIDIHTTIGDGSASYEVAGRVKYTLTQQPILSRDLFDVTLNPEITVSTKGMSFPINVGSFDTVDLTGRTSALVERSYFLRGGPLSASLVVQFEVTPNRMSLANISIQ